MLDLKILYSCINCHMGSAAGWLEKKEILYKEERGRKRQTKTPLMGCLLFWGAIRLGLCDGGSFVSQYLPDLDSEESFCLLKHPHAPGGV